MNPTCSGPVEAAPEGGVVSEVGRTGEGREPNNDTAPTNRDSAVSWADAADGGVAAAQQTEGSNAATSSPLDDLFPPEITALLVASGYSVLGWVDLNRLGLDKPKEATT